MQRTTALFVALILTMVGVNDLSAQRRGFIIGFGVGPGVTSYKNVTIDGEQRESKLGVATDFKIGAQVSPAVQVYYLNRVQFFGGSGDPDAFIASDVTLVATGLSGIGVTYVLPTSPVHLSGAIGIAAWNEFSAETGTGYSGTGLGLTAGVGYEFADLWLFDFAIQYGTPGIDFGGVNLALDVLQIRAGISVLGH